MRRRKRSEFTRKPFYDGQIDIKRWKARKKADRLRKRIRNWFRKHFRIE